MINTPILFLLFNRPDLTERVFNAIRDAKPRQLFIAGDGPRKDRYGEEELCERARRVVLNNIDWPCEVHTLLRESNVGCKIAVSNAVTWFFGQVEEGIILEDDCLPHPSFFSFCEELLLKYRDDPSIFHISGDCFLRRELSDSYYFTKYPHIWGWATWRRAWLLYDVRLEKWEKLKGTNFLYEKLKDRKEVEYWFEVFNSVLANEIDTWDHQWTFAAWYNNGLSIAPTVNLISNIGFSESATHTKTPNKLVSGLSTSKINITRHPINRSINKYADKYIKEKIYLGKVSSLKYLINRFRFYTNAFNRKIIVRK
jgi:hypothetical protein